MNFILFLMSCKNTEQGNDCEKNCNKYWGKERKTGWRLTAQSVRSWCYHTVLSTLCCACSHCLCHFITWNQCSSFWDWGAILLLWISVRPCGTDVPSYNMEPVSIILGLVPSYYMEPASIIWDWHTIWLHGPSIHHLGLVCHLTTWKQCPIFWNWGPLTSWTSVHHFGTGVPSYFMDRRPSFETGVPSYCMDKRP